jgi:ribosomal-protein-alanine N-acetyltransferase
MTTGWPVRLSDGPVGLRPIERRDSARWHAVRASNREWLQRWESTPPHDAGTPISFGTMVRRMRREAKEGRALPFVVTYDRELVGQLTVGGITYGSLWSAHIGYWIDSRMAGRGIMPTATALAIDHCFRVLGLHRVEVNIRPENTASLRVVEKLGLRDEGLRDRFLHIAGDWRDHRSFAICVEEVPEGMLTRYKARNPSAH